MVIEKKSILYALDVPPVGVKIGGMYLKYCSVKVHTCRTNMMLSVGWKMCSKRRKLHSKKQQMHSPKTIVKYVPTFFLKKVFLLQLPTLPSAPGLPPVIS